MCDWADPKAGIRREAHRRGDRVMTKCPSTDPSGKDGRSELLLLAEPSARLDVLVRALEAAGYTITTTLPDSAEADALERYVAVVLEWCPNQSQQTALCVRSLRARCYAGLVLISDRSSLSEFDVRDAVGQTGAVAYVGMTNTRELLLACRTASAVAWTRRGRAGQIHAALSDAVRSRQAFVELVAELLAERGGLGARMTEALRLKLQGWLRESAAKAMGVSENTYRNHIQKALQRLNADGFDELWRIVGEIVDAEVGGLKQTGPRD